MPSPLTLKGHQGKPIIVITECYFCALVILLSNLKLTEIIFELFLCYSKIVSANFIG